MVRNFVPFYYRLVYFSKILFGFLFIKVSEISVSFQILIEIKTLFSWTMSDIETAFSTSGKKKVYNLIWNYWKFYVFIPWFKKNEKITLEIVQKLTWWNYWWVITLSHFDYCFKNKGLWYSLKLFCGEDTLIHL